jgi:putative phage-type endonuclease
MKILNCIQGSDEWLQARVGVLTASIFADIITPTKGEIAKKIDDVAFNLAVEKITGEREESYTNAAMQRGNDLEPIAREAYEQHKLELVEEVGLMLSDCGNYGYSPDGLIGDDGLIEIKCPLANTHASYLLSNELPSKYKAQVQGGLFVSGRKWCDFVSYHPSFGAKSLMIVRVERDEEFIQKLHNAIQLFILKRDDFLNKLAK